MNLSSSALKCGAKDYIVEQNQDYWIGTAFEGYKFLGNKQKGQFGEKILDGVFTELGCKVERPLNPSHDSIINGVKIEYKFSLSQQKNGIIQKNTWMMNHVAEGKDWEWLCFAGINPDGTDDVVRLMSKENFQKILANENYLVTKGLARGKIRNKYFGAQQGGEKADNDDWMSGSKRLVDLLNSKYTIGIEEWMQIYA